jgi:hypothetical protein
MLTYPTLLVPFCAWLLMGYFKTAPTLCMSGFLSAGAVKG